MYIGLGQGRLVQVVAKAMALCPLMSPCSLGAQHCLALVCGPACRAGCLIMVVMLCCRLPWLEILYLGIGVTDGGLWAEVGP